MTISGLVLVRALAILLVVANHAKIARGLHGGLNALVLVSGIAMATFAFGGTTQQTLRAFARFAARLAIPSFALALLTGLSLGELRWEELAFFSNWLSTDRVALFPIWYVQAMVQLLIGVGVVFWALDLTPKIQRAPRVVTARALAVSAFVCLASYALWDTSELKDKLPHLLAWNLAFGWFLWATLSRGERTRRDRLVLTGALLACEIPIFLIADADHGESRFLWLTIFASVLIWRDEVRLPAVAGRIVVLVSQATFWIFLLHRYAFLAASELGQWLGLGDALATPPARMLAGIVLPVLAWAWFTACSRTFKSLRNELAHAAG